MTEQSAQIVIVGAGRMGRGIALSYVFAGIPVALVDLKKRSSTAFANLRTDIRQELTQDLNFFEKSGLVEASSIANLLDAVSIVRCDSARTALASAKLVFEAVPEVKAAKEDALTFVSEAVSSETIIASTTSTYLVTELAEIVQCPQRFLNAHWLNPAHLMPLVEISKSDKTSQTSIDTLVASLEAIGKVPVVCAATAGYIVPRIQALAMNEAARIVEEGVASAEDVDKAVNLGFGLRFSVLGLLEFIDWGGGDILFHASNYLANNLDQRYASPPIISKNMAEGKTGIREGQGFFNYEDVDANEYREQRLYAFVEMLKHKKLLPVRDSAIAKQEQSIDNHIER